MSTTTVNPTPSVVRSTGTLFDPLPLGRYSLRHRILMAPLTRSRARQPGNLTRPAPTSASDVLRLEQRLAKAFESYPP